MSRRAELMLALLLWIAGAAIRFSNLENVAVRTPDERVYAAQARTILREGLGGVRLLSARYRAVPEERLYPPPTRIGYLLALAAVMRLSGIEDERAGSRLACAASLGAMAIAILLAWQFLDPWVAPGAALLLALFSPDLVLARRCWQDSLVSLLGTLLLRAAFRALAGPARCRWSVAFAACGSALVLVKEGTIPVCGLCAAWLCWRVFRSGDVGGLRVLLAAIAAGGVCTMAILAGCAGSLGAAVEIIAGIPAANAANAYALEYASGPGYLLLAGYWALCPAALLLACAGLWICLRHRISDAASGLAWLVIALHTVAMLVPHWLNFRYLSVTFAPLCLLGGIALRAGYLALRSRFERFDFAAAAGLAGAALLVALLAGYQHFESAYVRGGTPDLSIRMVLESR